MPARLAAQDYGAAAVVERPRIVAMHDEDPTAAGTSLDLVQRISEPRSLGEVVREAPGARVQNTGALGAFASVSLRGTDANETRVMLDEIPLTTPDGGAFDLSLFPTPLFQRVDVFRGGAPVWLGAGAIGGVLRLVPRRAQGMHSSAALGAGSFGAYQLSLGQSAGDRRLASSSHVVLRGAQNDYSYVDDQGTPFDKSDDALRRRKNAQLMDAAALGDVTLHAGKNKLHLVLLGHGRTGGFPGPASQPTPNIHRQSVRGLVGLGFERKGGGAGRGPRYRLALVGSAATNLDRYTDLYGELGTSRQRATDDQGYRGFLRAALTLRLVRWLEASWVSSYAIDRYRFRDAFAFPRPSPSTRHTAASALELAARTVISGVKLELRPSLRYEWSHTELHQNTGLSGTFDATRSVSVPTARVGAGVEPWRGIAFVASFATGTRLPTIFELFGDRGQVLPSPDLKPVKATTYDAGLTLRRQRAQIAGSLELHAFYQQRQNAITMYRTTRYQVIHKNTGALDQWGLELGASGCWLEHFSVSGSFTFLDTDHVLHVNDQAGAGSRAITKQVPLRPRYVGFVRPELTQRFVEGPVSSVGAAAEVYYRSYVYVDRANLAYVPRCITLGASAYLALFRDRLKLSARIDDAANARCSDLVGYPLPGRSLFFSISVQEASDDHV